MTLKGSTPRVLRFSSIFPSILGLGTLLGALFSGTASAAGTPEGTHIRVKGYARVDAHAALAAGKVVLSGTVTDDAGRPSAGAEVALGLVRGPAAVAVPMGTASPESCRDASRPPALEGPERMILPADASGRFCVRLLLPKDRYVADLEVRGSPSLDGARVQVQLDTSLKPVTLRFDPERSVLRLDDDTSDIDVVASTEQDGVTTAAFPLWLGLGNETGAMLGGATTTASGRARFVVPGARLGQPGPGELRATFGGNADLGPSTCSIPVERHTRVDLAVPDATNGRRPAGAPEEGIAIPVVATARCARAGCTGAPTGTIEARVGETVVGAATLDRGEARLVVTFAMTGAEVPLRLHYAPGAPWFRPAEELVVTQPLRGPGAWKRLPLVIAGLGAIAWLVMARLPRRPARRDARSSPPRAPRGGARVELVRGETTSRGWTGQVIDADLRGPVADARVSIERRGFERTEAVSHATSDSDGKFSLEAVDALPGDELVAQAPLHAMLRRPLPPSGELRVALVLRRRALLDRLVAWARRRGEPFDAHAEPTPAQVRRAAGADIGVIRWASAVERAAFGGGTVDEQAQGEVDRLAPSDAAEESATGAADEAPRGRPARPRR